MKEEKQTSVTKEIFKNYKRNFADKTTLVTLLLIGILLCLVLAYFLPITIFVTVPLVLLPLLTGFIISNMSAGMIPNVGWKIFKGFKSYFSMPFFGSYRIIVGFLKMILVYLISSSTLTIIFHFTIGMNDPSYVEALDKILTIENSGVLLTYIEELQENSSFILMSNLAIVISFGLAAYMFLHHVITHSFKVFFNFFYKKMLPMTLVNYVHSKAFSKFRKDFYKDYYSSFWFIFLLFIAGYVGGVFLGMLLLNRDGLQSAIIGLAIGTFSSIYFLPYLYDTFSLMFTINYVYYLEGLIEVMKSAFVVPYAKGSVSQKEMEELDKTIDEMKRIIKENEEKAEEKKDDNEK